MHVVGYTLYYHFLHHGIAHTSQYMDPEGATKAIEKLHGKVFTEQGQSLTMEVSLVCTINSECDAYLKSLLYSKTLQGRQSILRNMQALVHIL